MAELGRSAAFVEVVAAIFRLPERIRHAVLVSA
jgi:hypothetical protein